MRSPFPPENNRYACCTAATCPLHFLNLHHAAIQHRSSLSKTAIRNAYITSSFYLLDAVAEAKSQNTSARLDLLPASIRMTMKLLTAAAATLLSTASYSSRSSARAFSSASNHLLNPSRSSNRDHRLSVIANTRGGGTLTTSPHQPFSATPFSRKIVRAFNRPTPTEVESDVATVVDAYELVKESASKMTAGEKLDMMRRKMEECGVDGKFLAPSPTMFAVILLSLPETTYLCMITLSYWRAMLSPHTTKHKY